MKFELGDKLLNSAVFEGCGGGGGGEEAWKDQGM